jgi:hypothetical protein
MKMAVFWVDDLRSLVYTDRRFRRAQCPVSIYQTIRRITPEDNHLYINLATWFSVFIEAIIF